MKILLVEDDMNLGFVVQDNLKMNGYKVHLSKNGKSGLTAFHGNQFDLCILDIMLPEQDGFSLAKDIRKVDQNIPIIFLTAKSMSEDKIKGFLSGADDYITKPFSPREVVLRVRSVLKRSVADFQKEITAKIEAKGVIIDIDRRQVNYKGKSIDLTATEFDLLSILAKAPGRVFTRNLLMDMVWGQDYYGVDRTVDTHMSRLRRKLGDGGKNLQTVHGIGYRFKE